MAKTKPAMPEKQNQPRVQPRPQSGIQHRVPAAIQRSVRDIKTELKKVVWPSREDATKLTMIVIAVMAAVGVILGGVDFIFAKLFEFIIGGF